MMNRAIVWLAVAAMGAGAATGCFVADADDLYGPTPEYNCATALSPWPPPPKQPLAVRVDLTLPEGERLDTLSVEIQPQPGHARLPENMPKLHLVQILGDGTIATVGSVGDESETVEEYEEPHRLEIVAPAKAAPPYAALAFPESGDGAVSYGRFLGWRCTTRPAP